MSRAETTVRNTVREFDIMKLEPISVGKIKRKNSIERYIATLSDGTQRYFKRCRGGCGELLTYESFPKHSKTKDGRYNDCGRCIAETRSKKQAEIVARANEKRSCSMCGEEKELSEYSTDGKGYRTECRSCQYKGNTLRNHARASRGLGLHVKLDGEGIEDFRDIVMNAACVLTGSYDNVTNDHIIPTSLTGGSHIGNLLPMHRSLNSSKGALPFFLWVRTQSFRDIAKKHGITKERIHFYKWLAAELNFMTIDQYERYTLFVWKMQQNAATKHITANPTFSEASEHTTGRVYGFSHEGQVYYRPTVTEKEKDEIYAKWDAEQMTK
ncbi:HNH endonuclease signature motif containing protein [Bacillus cereus]|uniref:HNH endonuclease signature motif containing protein n=1 Tax=Bacillus cereus TaxID=1396 RepID=UPI001F0AD852|nr:HNH endonuclease signature motif containing protein [Bacillus cereus]